MKRNRVILFTIVALLLSGSLAYLLIPANAVSGTYRIHQVEQDGRYITEDLEPAALESLAALVSRAKCRRWSNPLGAHPVKGSICIHGMDDNGPCFFYLVGSTGRYSVNDHELIRGEQLLEQVQDLLNTP